MITEPYTRKFVPVKESMTRAWILIKLKESASDRGAVAASIYNELNEDYSELDNVFVIRVDVVSERNDLYDLVAPLYTNDDYEKNQNHDELATLNAIEEYLKGRGEVDSFHTLIVDQHVPYPTWKTMGYITWQEVNSPGQGPTSHRPW